MSPGAKSAHPLTTAARLLATGTEYALVTVVRVEAPASARPGDKAVVTADGTFHGWVGGGCAQPAVVKAVRLALADGKTRLLRIAPSSDGERELGDVLEFGMACHSGGTLELLIDPVLRQPQLLIFGTSPVAATLAQLAPRVGFAVTVAAPGAQAVDFPDAQLVLDSDDASQLADRVPAGAYVVVATQGRRDLHALHAALAMRAHHVSLVASVRKASVLKKSLLATGADAEAVQAIVAPAGYPIAASTPEEIALSVLAALVAQRRGAHPSPAFAAEGSCCDSAAVAAQRAGALATEAASTGSCCET
ncbi:MAG TPA: XdhC family protein [Burkholderiaceae bacterium]|nr:XdhC family protein [Burkholderiaceae bacterium]